MLEPVRPVRCAIYTRKSTEEGLEQDFNSLEAQRESAQAYVVSQNAVGWRLLPERYDDGGFSGATLQRPALAKLLADIEAGQVDCVVVYKVDRLSRSLLDFTHLMSLFERRGVSFVSTTQQFNTTTSLGRLTLNLLLSFAEFERDLIGERTRDKLAAARRKGKWTGGVPVLGYDLDPQGRRLVVNEDEARQVRAIFTICAETGTLAGALREVNGRGYQTKDWTSRAGRRRRGRAFTESTLSALLRNVLYTGSVRHQGLVYAGEQPGIVDRDVWERVNNTLLINSCSQRGRAHTRNPAPLLGLLGCSHCGRPMRATQSRRGGRSYVYYACKGSAGRPGCKHRSVAAQELESKLMSQVEAVLGPNQSWASMQPAVERVLWDGERREVTVALRGGTSFQFRLPTARQGRANGGTGRAAGVPRVSRLMAVAIETDRKLRDRTLGDHVEAARLGGVSIWRLRQILALLNLSPAIQEQVLFLPRTVARSAVTEKRLRQIAGVMDWQSQQALFDQLFASGSLL